MAYADKNTSVKRQCEALNQIYLLKKTKHKTKKKLHSPTRINATLMQEQMKNIVDGTSPALIL